MMKKITFKSIFWSLVALFIVAMGVAFSTKVGLGTSPIASPSYALTFVFPLTLGECVVITNIFLILGQIIILKKDFDYFQLTQFISIVILGVFVDIGMLLANLFTFQNYFLLLLEQVLGCVLLAFGIRLEIAVDCIFLPGEGFVEAMVTKYNWKFGIVKILFDLFMVLLAALITLIFSGEVQGIREGTLIAAIVVGLLIRYCDKPIEPILNYVSHGGRHGRK